MAVDRLDPGGQGCRRAAGPGDAGSCRIVAWGALPTACCHFAHVVMVLAGVLGRRVHMPAPALSSLAHDEPLGVTGSVGVVPASRAGAGRGARHRADRGVPPLFRAPRPGTSIAVPQTPSRSTATNPCVAAEAPVVPAGRAGARRGARHRADPGVPLVQGPQAGHLDRRAPDAVPLAGHEPLRGAAAVRVVPGGRAVARRGARHRVDLGVHALVQGRQAGYLDRRAPDAVPLGWPRTPARCRGGPASPRRPRSCPPRRTTPRRPRRSRPCSGPPGRAPRSPCPRRRSARLATNPCR